MKLGFREVRVSKAMIQGMLFCLLNLCIFIDFEIEYSH